MFNFTLIFSMFFVVSCFTLPQSGLNIWQEIIDVVDYNETENEQTSNSQSTENPLVEIEETKCSVVECVITFFDYFELSLFEFFFIDNDDDQFFAQLFIPPILNY